MRRRACLWLGLAGALCGAAAAADPSAPEQARIDKLIASLAQRPDIKFIRNGKEYSGAQAADFLRGKLQWRSDKVATARDFIEQIGTRSTTSGDIYRVRLADGRTMPSAEFLNQELQRIAKR